MRTLVAAACLAQVSLAFLTPTSHTLWLHWSSNSNAIESWITAAASTGASSSGSRSSESGGSGSGSSGRPHHRRERRRRRQRRRRASLAVLAAETATTAAEMAATTSKADDAEALAAAGVEIKASPGKGMGAFAARPFAVHEVVGDYWGEVLSATQHAARYGATVGVVSDAPPTAEDEAWAASRAERGVGMTGDYVVQVTDDLFVDAEVSCRSLDR